MTTKDILRAAFFGAIVYGAYKFGERQGQKRTQGLIPTPPSPQPKYEEAEVVVEKSEHDYIREIIQSLRNKPSKTRKDRDTIELLEIKLKQLLNK